MTVREKRNIQRMINLKRDLLKMTEDNKHLKNAILKIHNRINAIEQKLNEHNSVL
jgi:hypothetical protein